MNLFFLCLEETVSGAAKYTTSITHNYIIFKGKIPIQIPQQLWPGFPYFQYHYTLTKTDIKIFLRFCFSSNLNKLSLYNYFFDEVESSQHITDIRESLPYPFTAKAWTNHAYMYSVIFESFFTMKSTIFLRSRKKNSKSNIYILKMYQNLHHHYFLTSS